MEASNLKINMGQSTYHLHYWGLKIYVITLL